MGLVGSSKTSSFVNEAKHIYLLGNFFFFFFFQIIGKCKSQAELNEYCRLHESLKVKYVSTLFDTRCVLFGPCNSFSTPSNFKSTALMFDCSLDSCKSQLIKDMNELLSSVFWILESKLQERSREKVSGGNCILIGLLNTSFSAFVLLPTY